MGNIISSAPGVVPAGVTFGQKVLVIPRLGDGFTHSGYIIGLINTYSGQWINRGEYFAKYVIRTRKVNIPIIKHFFGDEDNVSYLKSPVSGLILHGTYTHHCFIDLPDEPPPVGVHFAILLPDDEDPAENGHYIFSDVCNLVRQHQEIFFKQSRHWSMPAFEKGELNKYLDWQESSKCREYIALPNWKNCFKAVRTNFPILRPLLKHLAHKQV